MYWTGRNKSDVVVPPRFGLQFDDLRLSIQQVTFLYCLIATFGHKTLAAQAARISRATHFYWLSGADNKEDYRRAYERTLPMVAVALEDAALERAAHGVEEPVFYKGEICGTVLKFSDSLMSQLLKGVLPEKYRERTESQVGNKPGETFKLDPGREVLSDQKLSALLELGQKVIDAETAAIVAATKLKPESETPK
jgi:hypothetical protein